MPPTKLYKFAAAAVMSTVAVATVVTFTSSEQAGSSPVSALPRVPGANAVAPTVGVDETPETSPPPVTRQQPTSAASPSASPSPTTSSRSSSRSSGGATSEPSKPKAKTPPSSPSPSPSPTRDGLLGGLLGF